MRYFLMLALSLSLLGAGSAGAAIRYYPDPVHVKLSPADPHPMDDMVALANDGNVRAQFIIADLYSKGKGGFAKNLKTARHWFEESAIHGYDHSFIRLAALAKHQDNPAEAWQWYTLAINALDDGSDEQKYAIHARQDLMDKAQLSEDDIRQARDSMSAWQDMSNKQLQAEQEASRAKELSQKAAAEKAEAEKATATVTAAAGKPDNPPPQEPAKTQTPTGETENEQD